MDEIAHSPPHSKMIQGISGFWEVVIGVEVHAQVLSKSKLFSRASAAFGGQPNSHVSLIDAAMPGMLPVLNEACVSQAVRTGLGLKARINHRSVFERKHYFYPDLPQGYQISQHESPIIGEGHVIVDIPDGTSITVRIERIHLEQDAGKLIHDRYPSYSCLDMNRSGVALMEIVSRPDLRSAKDTKAYIGKLRTILRYLETCDGNMEQGSLRADVNLSVRRAGEPLGTRCEIKNLNSIRFIGQAIDYESRRQIAVLEENGTINQETRLFDSKTGETRPMRTKESVRDYRYFPDPDLLPLEISQAYIDEIASALPELPDEKKSRFMSDYGLKAYDASVLVADRNATFFFEEVAQGRDARMVANWIINELFGRLKKEALDITISPVSAYQLGSIIDLVVEEVISSKIAKDLFEIIWIEGGEPREVVEAHGLQQMTNTGEIEKIIDNVISANPDKMEKIKLKPAMIGWFVGQVIKKSGGKANPQIVDRILRKRFDFLPL
ncbi:MAG: Asp-tRNA(Asn)/Glu-tRNA(Gln) amidotransferase subunit GatB [Alphaproteobacteria bacterium]|nr:Asp-tRNA(Asn)/Glu-tRNA(Gln) amidotransferase subunit GatB [Alphaproteobacteria bacterium]